MSNEFNLTAAISACLDEYGKEIREEVEELTDEVAGEMLNEIKANSPIGKHGARSRYQKGRYMKRGVKGLKSGKYRKGWRLAIDYTALGKKTAIVYNATDYQLTFLLENGHKNRDGTIMVAAPIKHIKPAEKKAVEKFEKGVEEIIKNAGRNL